MKCFITYGDEKFEAAKRKIVHQAEQLGCFDSIIAYNRSELSDELRASPIIKIQRGGGLWSWKPDVIWQTINKAQNDDIIVYCDSGCELQKSPEWDSFWNVLKSKDLIAQRIFQRNDCWTRKELVDYFSANGRGWLKCYQYAATVVILKVSEFTRELIKEWRHIMIHHPKLAMDVTNSERIHQYSTFIENRHDQAIYSALIYKYLARNDDKIYTQWEHFENLDIFFKQAIRATRLRQGEKEALKAKTIHLIKRIVKDYISKPFYYIPIEKYRSFQYQH